MKQTKKKQVIIVEELSGDLTFLTEKEFLEEYKNFDFIQSTMYIRHGRLRKFTKNGIKTFIGKLKDKHNGKQ